MPRRKKAQQDELIDQLLQGQGPEELLKSLTAAIMNRALGAELTERLDYEEGEAAPEEQPNRRNGHRTKRVRTGRGEVEVKVPRDRAGPLEPRLITWYQRAIPASTKSCWAFTPEA